MDFARPLNSNTYGNGSLTMVLSHGYGADQSVWRNIVSPLSICFKVLVYDLAFNSQKVDDRPELYDSKKYSNYGGYADDLTSMLDELNIKGAIFVGHSMSAMIGCIAAVRRPDLIRHLVLLNGSPRYLDDKETEYTGGFSRPQVDSIFQSIETNYSGWVEGFAPVAIGVENKTAIGIFESSLLRLSPGVALSTAETVFLSDYRDVLPRVRVPSTIIQSKDDAIVPNAVAHYMKEKLDANMTILETKGHFLQLTEPSLLVEVLKGIKY